MLAAIPDFDARTVNPPGIDWPRLLCFFFFHGDYTKPDSIQTLAWCVPSLRETCYSLDKEHARAISRLAIPQLLDEINVLRDPQQAVQRFQSMVMNPEEYLTSMRMVDVYGEEELF